MSTVFRMWRKSQCRMSPGEQRSAYSEGSRQDRKRQGTPLKPCGAAEKQHTFWLLANGGSSRSSQPVKPVPPAKGFKPHPKVTGACGTPSVLCANRTKTLHPQPPRKEQNVLPFTHHSGVQRC